jgi:hypothetical protein
MYSEHMVNSQTKGWFGKLLCKSTLFGDFVLLTVDNADTTFIVFCYLTIVIVISKPSVIQTTKKDYFKRPYYIAIHHYLPTAREIAMVTVEANPNTKRGVYVHLKHNRSLEFFKYYELVCDAFVYPILNLYGVAKC